MIRSNMKHLKKKDPQKSNKPTKPLVKVFEWTAGALEVNERTFESIESAKEFIGKIKSNEVHIKMYNEKQFSPQAIVALKDALSVIYWRKEDLQDFILNP